MVWDKELGEEKNSMLYNSLFIIIF